MASISRPLSYNGKKYIVKNTDLNVKIFILVAVRITQQKIGVGDKKSKIVFKIKLTYNNNCSIFVKIKYNFFTFFVDRLNYPYLSSPAVVCLISLLHYRAIVKLIVESSIQVKIYTFLKRRSYGYLYYPIGFRLTIDNG